MNKNKISKIVALGTLVVMSSAFIACGADAKEVKDNIVAETTQKEEIKDNEEVEKKKEVVKIDFSKYSDEEILNFANSATDDIENMKRYTAGGMPIEEEKFSLIELLEEDIEERETVLLKYYNDISLLDEYENRDGKVYLKDYYWDNHIPYLFKGVKSKEVINDTTLRVVFTSEFYHGFPVVNKNIKTVDFTEVDGELKAKTLLSDKSIYGVIENKDELKEIKVADNEAKALWDYVYEKLNDGVLRDDQRVGGLGEREYDSSTNSIYYGISIIEPTQSAISYYVNISNGDIYGHYEGKFVVKGGQVVK